MDIQQLTRAVTSAGQNGEELRRPVHRTVALRQMESCWYVENQHDKVVRDGK